MNRRMLVWGMCMVMTWISQSRGGELDFREDFALAPDRAAVLKQLVPGTEDFYYFHALHYLHTEQYEKADQLLAPWVQRHGDTPRVWEIRTRYALLTYDKNPEKSLQYLRGRLNLTYPHARELLDAEPNFPTALDVAQFSRAKFAERAFAQSPHDVSGFDDSALDWLIGLPLTPDQRRSLLTRLQRPDYPKLTQLIADDLKHPNSGGFGSLAIHKQLLLAQLDELLKLQPDLLNQHHFVVAYLIRLQPGADENWRHDPQLLAAFLTRLEAFAKRLEPAHNSLKAHVLYHQLELARREGKYDKDRFLAYLQLPRPVGYISKQLQESESMRRFPCDLNANYEGVTLLPVIGNDEPLMRDYLAHFLVEAKNTQEFDPYVNDIYLKHLFAKVKIVNGLGEPEQWASLLPPEMFQQLKERVDIDFAFTNQINFAAAEPVQLELSVKNVQTLIVKVFEINTQNYYRTQGREIDTDINLDGLVANFEETFTYDESPLRRVTRKFDFPQLSKPGVYVVDFIGNGRSSRALIRRGALKHLVRTTSAGQTFTLLDQDNQVMTDARLWLAGHEYKADKDGSINVPFSTNPGRQAIVLTAKTKAGEYSSLAHFVNEAEAYQLQVGFYVDREELLKRKTANLVLRTGLSVSGAPVSVKLLENVKLVITSTDLDNVSSQQELSDISQFEDRETTHEFQVPARLAQLRFTLTAKVAKVSSGGQKVDLSATDNFSLNGIDKTDKIEDLHLLQANGEYFLELRGKTGEARPSKPVNFVIKHRDFTQSHSTTLKTDPTGRITLGKLPEIASVTAQDPAGTSHTWVLPVDAHTYPSTLQGRAGETLVLPYLPRRENQALAAAQPAELTRADVSLLELRGNSYVADRFDNIRVADGLLHLEKLPAGDYSLWLKSVDAQIHIRITEGKQTGRFAVGVMRQLETPVLKPVQIADVKLVAKDDKSKERIVVRLANATKFTRVHVFATRMLPAYDVFESFARVRGGGVSFFVPGHADSVYLTGRNIGDEYRYIIDRKYAHKYPGNMLARPSLLLNPWAVRETDTGEQVALGGETFGAKRSMVQAYGGIAAPDSRLRPEQELHQFANLDFLAEQSVVLTNLVPNDQGELEITRSALGTHQQIRIVAVDPVNTMYRNYSLPEQKAIFNDLRLANGFNPQAHFTEQKQITIVPAGQKFTLHDITTSKFEAYDSLPRVYGLYATLNHDAKLAEFDFILRWPSLKDEEKRELYSKYASHELSFFLFKKDPAFFKTVIAPYLKNKKDKTFMDHFLLEDDLQKYLRPWAYSQLNIPERILLSRRIADEQASTARHVTDLYQRLPPNVDNFIRLFDTAVQRSALDTSDPLGLTAATEAREKLSARYMVPLDPAAPPPAPAAEPAPVVLQVERAKDQLKQVEESLKEAKKDMPARKGGIDKQLRDRAEVAEMSDATAEHLYFDIDGGEQKERELVRAFFRKLEKTKEWAENNYYHLTIDQQNADLITVNAFWLDFAQHDPQQPFLSRNLAEASRNFPEMLLALAVLDLPFESPKHETKFGDSEMTLIPGGPLVVFHEEVRPSAAPEAGSKVLVSQNFFRQSDRYRTENGEQVDKFIREEFLVQVVYGCQVVVTNPTSTRQKLNLLLQIPAGSLPVQNGQATKSVHLTLEPYHTQTLDYFFYFPSAGKFTHFPVHVARNETLIAAAPALLMNVVDKPTKIDTKSWDYISQFGTDAEVLTFLDEQNVEGIDLDRIAWRMRDAKLFETVTKELTQRHTYSQTLWSYSLLNNNVAAAREYLQHADGLVNEIGGRVSSTLLTIDPVARRSYEHLEYMPLVNARVHALGKRRHIVNDQFFQQYLELLRELAYQPKLTSDDWLAVTYYLLLQDRVEEALVTFQRVDAKQVSTQLQYDYCAAYLNFFGEDHAVARAIAIKHAKHPVDRWRNTFTTIIAQLDEAEGKGVVVVDPENREQQQTELAATAPSLDIVVEAKQVKVDYQNLKSVRVNFYEMDVELLFSRNPFVQHFQGEFSSIKANHSLEVPLPAGKRTHVVPLPKQLLGRNVIVEVTGGGETKTQTYFAHSLAVQVIENYGQVKVTEQTTGKPVSTAYVKVYAQRADGTVKFYKDGYTDLRGRFDYASLSTNDLEGAAKFSILILSDELGALVREAAPPKQ